MSAIRPIATIAILAVLGVFLAMRINEKPLAPTASADGEWGGEAPAFGGEAPAFGDAPAFGEAPTFDAPPAFGGGPPLSSAPATPPAPAFAESPGIPPLPSLPPAGSSIETPAAAIDPGSVNLPDLPLPDNIPQADYGSATAAPPSPSGPSMPAGQVPSLGTATPGYPATPPVSAAIDPPATAEPPPASPGYDGPSFGAASPYPSLSPSTLESANASPVAPVEPESGYATARPAIQAALDRDELGRAHLLLSQWYGDPALSADERSEVDRLLGQLAGTVIYSTQHRLEPPHQVQPGETLETIASSHQVPWQLLAKINGVSRSDAIQPGQILKVVRGPFDATVDLSDGEVYLTNGGRYAGRFPAKLAGVSGPTAGWKVAGKSGGQIALANAAGGEAVISTAGTPTPPGKPAVSVADKDFGDLFDILSEGSSVTVRR